MPKLDGYEVCSVGRSSHLLGIHVMLTARSRSQGRRRATATFQPFEPCSLLLDRISKILAAPGDRRMSGSKVAVTTAPEVPNNVAEPPRSSGSPSARTHCQLEAMAGWDRVAKRPYQISHITVGAQAASVGFRCKPNSDSTSVHPTRPATHHPATDESW